MADNVFGESGDTTTEYDDVFVIALGNCATAGPDTISDAVSADASEESHSADTSFTNPIYAEIKEGSLTFDKELYQQNLVDRQAPIDRLVKYSNAKDSYNRHKAIDRVRRLVEDNDSGDESSTLIQSTSAEQLPSDQAPIDRIIATVRQEPTPNKKTCHPLDRLLNTAATRDSKHPVLDRIEAKLQAETALNPRLAIDRIAGDVPAPKCTEKLAATLSADTELPPASSSKPIDKLMRAALISDSCLPREHRNHPLDRIAKTVANPECGDRKPIDRLTKSLTGRSEAQNNSSTATPLGRLEKNLIAQ